MRPTPPAPAHPAIRFLLGPAGSGKTHRCLAEVRERLRNSPEGPPLLFLAPKQATYQLERQLLEDPSLPGWSRLQILSFDRLAHLILSTHQPVSLLAEEGRLMVLRALVRRLGPQLRVYHASSRLAGFAAELSRTLRELRNHRLSPDRLADLASTLGARSQTHLAHKLHDLGLILRAYQAWLAEHHIEDADSLPDLATNALASGSSSFQLDGLWLDGFAEMTPQELDLLAAVLQRTGHATLAFCIDHQPACDASWLSTWSVVSQTFRRCHARIAAAAPAQSPPAVELLPSPDTGRPSRFTSTPALEHLARTWAHPAPAPQAATEDARQHLRLVACRDPEAEAILAARTILRHTQAGGRFREIAVLVRSLEPFHATLERTFVRYRIPFFLDRRESLAHHPLAELSRAALRLAAFGWPAEDWFGALKTDLAGLASDTVDALENEALARGWTARTWLDLAEAAPSAPTLDTRVDPHRLRAVIRPFRDFTAGLPQTPDAPALANALRSLWKALDVHETLRRWQDSPAAATGPAAPHLSAWEQLQSWLENLERGFGREQLTVQDWLPILEAGLSSLTAGVIPSSQDQVLVGAIDRSRQPDIRIALVLGLNEGIFPAPPPTGGMLSDDDRQRLLEAGVTLGPDRRRKVGHERYFGYIACTRPRETLVLTWSQRDADGNPLNPSPFLRDLAALFPDLAPETDAPETIDPACSPATLAERVLHRCELEPWLLHRTTPTRLDGLAGDDLRRDWLRRRRQERPSDHLKPSIARALVGVEPELSVSSLETLGACPFQFFVRHALRGSERETFETDGRTLGSLAHDLLARFHEAIRNSGRRWRDVDPAEARELLDRLAATAVDDFQEGICRASASARWKADRLVDSLRSLVVVLVDWARTNDFDPVSAELAFGTLPKPEPETERRAWPVDTGDGRRIRVRGKIDRIDRYSPPDGPTRFLIVDYKKSLAGVSDELMAAGTDLQLAAYCLAVAANPEWLAGDGISPREAIPAGMFYVPLQGRAEAPSARSRNTGQGPAEEMAEIHRHRGRFDGGSLRHLDRTGPSRPSGQFSYKLKKDGTLYKNCDGRSGPEFLALLETARAALAAAARQVLDGRFEVSPFAHGRDVACDRCGLLQICRFDPAVQGYRRTAAGHPPARDRNRPT